MKIIDKKSGFEVRNMNINKKIEITKTFRIKTKLEIYDFVNNLEHILYCVQNNKKCYVGEYTGKGKHTKFKIDNCLLFVRNFLKQKKVGNDAPRMGQQGNYVLFSNNKENIETLLFIKNFVNTLL